MPDPVKLESAPPAKVILEEIKAVEAASLRVKVMVAVSPDFKAEDDEVIVMVGAMVSARVMLWVALVNPDEAKVSV